MTTAKTPFLSNLLISLYYKSVKGVSCTRTNISTGGDYFANIPVELTDIPIKLTDMPIELIDIPIEVR